MKHIHLRTARERKRLTQEQLEAASGISQAVISKLERTPNAKAMADTLFALADALKVSPQALRFGPDPDLQERVAS